MLIKKVRLGLLLLVIGFLGRFCAAEGQNYESIGNTVLQKMPASNLVATGKIMHNGANRAPRQRLWPIPVPIFGGSPCSEWPTFPGSHTQGRYSVWQARAAQVFCQRLKDACEYDDGDLISCVTSPVSMATCESPISYTFEDTCTAMPGCSMHIVSTSMICHCKR
ncbi:uncharacterized protein LOC110861718 isoform X1 [Folsomia candida]|uniref:uncharacterized protein LOC110861718 isoform X1 n=1 Tax=Folsomia candida TaxID=158441 RepID=UPI000B8FE156|nr:uncharacterized protein LOC110861718 isoform X1 [Folsomia candida]